MSGWEPAEVTRYEYDDDGRLVTSITEREPEWCRADVEGLIAFLELGRVGPHGQPMSEATSPLANPSNLAREWDYAVDVRTDFAARRLNETKQAMKLRYGDDLDLEELRFTVRKVEL